MRLFSEREGYRPVKSVVQFESMDDDLRNRLWNNLDRFYWRSVKTDSYYRFEKLDPEMSTLVRRLWHDLFKKPVDTINDSWQTVRANLRDYYFGCRWNEAYDFIEFVAGNYPRDSFGRTQQFRDSCNDVLKHEVSAWRFVGRKIARIIDEIEIQEVEEALQVGIPAVRRHLQTSLDHFGDRKNPDYANSIKEAISAVEALSKMISQDEKADLDKALAKIESKGKVKLQSSLKSAFRKLYFYTSDAEGIRHALMEEPNLDAEDAKFMLVACSAFVNYLVVKAEKAGLKL